MPELRLRIIPEFEERAIRAFAEELNQAAGSASPGGVGVGVSSKGLAGAAGLGALAGGGALALIDMLLTEFKPLASMVKNITRMLMQFLRPVAEFIMFILQPIMQLLRPALQLFNAVFAPYRQAALQLSAESNRAFSEGDTGKGLVLSVMAASIILKPLNDMLLMSMGETLKLLLASIAGLTQGIVIAISTALAFIASIFSDEIAMKIMGLGGVAVGFIDNQKTIVQDAIDLGIAEIINHGNIAFQNFAKTLGVDVILPVIASEDNAQSLLARTKAGFLAFGDAAATIINEEFDEDTGFIGAFKTGMSTFQDSATKRVKEAMSSLDAAVSRANAAASSAERAASRARTREESLDDLYDSVATRSGLTNLTKSMTGGRR